MSDYSMNNIQESLLHIEQQLLQLRKDLLSVRLEIAQLQHSNKSITSSKRTVDYQDDQNRNTARR